MLAPLALLALLHACLACQPGHSTMYNGWCMRYSDWYEIFDHGFKDCQKDGTHPPVITSESDNKLHLEVGKHHGNGNKLLIGIVCDKSRQQLRWADGTEFTYKNFDDPNQSMSCKGDEYFAVDRSSGKWHQVKSNTLTFVDLFCQESRPAKVANCATNFSPIMLASGDSGFCYRIMPGATNWQNAEDICYNDYAHLPIIHDANTNDFLRRTGVANGFSSGFLIGQHGPNISTFGWVDGSATDYNNFQKGFPAAGEGDCGAMDVNGGKWINVDCGSKLPYMCTQEAVGRSTVSPPICPSTVFNNSGTISSPGFPWNGNTPCDFFLQVNDGENVLLTIDFIEANECCDFLDLYDGTIGGALLARISGSNRHGITYQTKKTNVMRVSWIPGGAVNVKGFKASFASLNSRRASRLA